MFCVFDLLSFLIYHFGRLILKELLEYIEINLHSEELNSINKISITCYNYILLKGIEQALHYFSLTRKDQI